MSSRVYKFYKFLWLIKIRKRLKKFLIIQRLEIWFFFFDLYKPLYFFKIIHIHFSLKYISNNNIILWVCDKIPQVQRSSSHPIYAEIFLNKNTIQNAVNTFLKNGTILTQYYGNIRNGSLWFKSEYFRIKSLDNIQNYLWEKTIW